MNHTPYGPIDPDRFVQMQDQAIFPGGAASVEATLFMNDYVMIQQGRNRIDLSPRQQVLLFDWLESHPPHIEEE